MHGSDLQADLKCLPEQIVCFGITCQELCQVSVNFFDISNDSFLGCPITVDFCETLVALRQREFSKRTGDISNFSSN